MTLQQLKDERVEQAKNKIYSELMLIIFYMVVLSFLVKAVYFNMNLEQCATEYIIMILCPLYQAIRSRQLGVVLTEQKPSWKKEVIPGIIILLVAAMIWLKNGSVALHTRNASALISILVFIALFAVVRSLFLYSERRRKEKLEHQFDDED